ncbi:hypothetical protein GGR26_000437 [Lewinella marina]|uniref:DUF2207 domain-containing protein n=1 Tax=Neolewinella marina TaxID=438751 RepID=UPI00142FD179|nr:DUF2207 domain-containing protein [Neolewinella marina]NJB84692.1 hypothetical protein [Neolewinella marina]
MRLLCLLLLSCLTLTLNAQESFPEWHADVHPRADRSIEVTERITVVSHGETVKRGITRTLPNPKAHPVEVLSVERDGEESPYHTRRSGGNLTIYAGDKKKTLRPGTYTYRVRYRIDGAVAREGELDELQFEVIGPDVSLPVGRATATVHLPDGLRVAQYACYTGKAGSTQGNCTIAAPENGRLSFTGVGEFGLGTQLSVAAGFEPGFFRAIEASTAAPEAAPNWFEREGSLLLFVLCVIGGIYFAYTRWRTYGVDPQAPRVGHVYAPPQGLSPAAVSHLASDFGASPTQEFTASLLALATRGYLSIGSEEESGWLGTHYRYYLRKTDQHPVPGELPAEQALLYEQLFAGRDTVKLKGEYDKFLYKASQSHHEAVASAYKDRYPVAHNLGKAWPLLGIYLLGIAAGVFASLRATGAPLWPWVITYIVLGGIGLGIFIWLIRRPSPELVWLRAEIAALKEYLSLSEGKRKRLLNAPEMSREHYEELLPYAIALGIHTKWTDYFQGLFDPAGYRPVWYFGGGAPFHAATFSERFTQVAGSSATPVQSSASGGGGSVGGGVGGGGAGGW